MQGPRYKVVEQKFHSAIGGTIDVVHYFNAPEFRGYIEKCRKEKMDDLQTLMDDLRILSNAFRVRKVHYTANRWPFYHVSFYSDDFELDAIIQRRKDRLTSEEATKTFGEGGHDRMAAYLALAITDVSAKLAETKSMTLLQLRPDLKVTLFQYDE